ncbi:MAG TPA: tRNA-uridine aminocarboxypropyltransferase [Cellvibrionaceae bacterium]
MPISSRTLCPSCQLPLPRCFCPWVTPLKNIIPIVILQHPNEAKHAKNTAAFLSACLGRCDIWPGESFGETLAERLAQLPNPWLLYPEHDTLDPATEGTDRNGISLRASPQRARGCENTAAGKTLDSRLRGNDGDGGDFGNERNNMIGGNAEEVGNCRHEENYGLNSERDENCEANTQEAPFRADSIGSLIVIDATWRKSLKMLHLNPILGTLPRLSLPAPEARLYRIRKARNTHQLSTFEASCYALGHIENNASHYQPGLAAFDRYMRQLASYRPQHPTGEAPANLRDTHD